MALFDITVTRTWSEVGVIRVQADTAEEARSGLESLCEELDGCDSGGIEFDPDSLTIEEYEIETVTPVGVVYPKRTVAEILAS